MRGEGPAPSLLRPKQPERRPDAIEGQPRAGPRAGAGVRGGARQGDQRRTAGGARVGVSWKPNVGDIREWPALKIIRLLLELGAQVVHDNPASRRCRALVALGTPRRCARRRQPRGDRDRSRRHRLRGDRGDRLPRGRPARRDGCRRRGRAAVGEVTLATGGRARRDIERLRRCRSPVLNRRGGGDLAARPRCHDSRSRSRPGHVRGEGVNPRVATSLQPGDQSAVMIRTLALRTAGLQACVSTETRTRTIEA